MEEEIKDVPSAANDVKQLLESPVLDLTMSTSD